MDQKINDSRPLTWSVYLLISDFLEESQSQKKLAGKVTNFTIQFRSKNFKPHLIQHYENYTPALPPKTLLTQTSFWLVSDKCTLHCIISMHPKTAFSKHLESKCLYISVNLRNKIFVPETWNK